MTVRFGNQTFPDTLEEFFEDRTVFFATFAKFATSSSVSESFDFLVDRMNGKKPQQLYLTYIMKDPKALQRMMKEAASGGKKSKVKMPKGLNIPGKLIQEMGDLAVANDWKGNKWEKLLKEAETEIWEVMRTNSVLPEFFKSPSYLRLMEHKMFPAVKSAVPKIVRKAKLTDHKDLAKDRKLLEMVKYARGTAHLAQRFHPKASGMKATSKKLFESLKKEYGFDHKFEDVTKAITALT